MRRVAYLTARCMVSEGPERRDDHWEHDLMFGALAPACRAEQIELAPVIWDDAGFDPADWDAVAVGTTWDYTDRPDEFLATLDRVAAATALFNPPDVLRWNLDKRYLAELAERGAQVVPTLWRDRADDATLDAAFDELEADVIVAKPQVGASAWRQVRIERGAALPDVDQRPPAATMIQPYLPAVATEGEYSFVFCGGELSHCALKVPAAGDYRVQSMYGARERVHRPSEDEQRRARAVLAASGGEGLLYARVDMVRGLGGELELMELELVEPYLYPEQGPLLGATYARALAQRLG